MPLKTCPFADWRLLQILRPLACATAVFASTAWAQNFPITPGQRATATQVAQAGVALSELAPNAPARYVVQRGDTLWAISRLFLQSPWRWPELWGMNLQDIANPHLIFPGQVLYLDTSSGRARLSMRAPGAAAGEPPTVRLSPRMRAHSLEETAIPPIALQAIKAFLTESMIVDEAAFARAPRIVATQESRVLLSRGDRAYARGLYSSGDPGVALLDGAQMPRDFRVFRNTVPLRDPVSGEILGHEAQFVGKARLESGESTREVKDRDGKMQTELVPATIHIVLAKREMRVGDRLLPEPPREFPHYLPSAPTSPKSGQIVSVAGDAITFAAQNQVVVINRGRDHGIERGHVLALQRDSHVVTDSTDAARPKLRLPGERNGLMMVFRTFDRVSYALVLEISDVVKVGDHFTNP